MSMQMVKELDGWVRGKVSVGRVISRRVENQFQIIGIVAGIEPSRSKHAVCTRCAVLTNGLRCGISQAIWSRPTTTQVKEIAS